MAPNPFCCRGRLGALPVVVLGFAFFVGWHYIRSMFAAEIPVDGGVDSFSLNGNPSMRGAHMSAQDVDELGQRLEVLGMIQKERDVKGEAELHPHHLLEDIEDFDHEGDVDAHDAGNLDDDLVADAADPDIHKHDDLKLVDKKKVDKLHSAKTPRKPKADDRGERAEELAGLIKESVEKGAIAEDDSMKFVDEDDGASAIQSGKIAPYESEGKAAESKAKKDEDNIDFKDVEGPIALLDVAVEEVAIDAHDLSTLTPYVQIDISIDGKPQPHMVFEMFKDDAPNTVANFETICQGFTNPDGNFIAYSGSDFHRIIPNFMMQGGQFKKQGNPSPFGARWADEPGALALKHTTKGILSMANAGPDTQSSQFFITFQNTPHLDGKHGVFGRIISGEYTLDTVNKLPMKEEKTISTVTFTKCSLLNAPEAVDILMR